MAGGGFSIGGLITGLDSNSIVSQLMAIERQPVTKLQNQVIQFGQQKESVQNILNSLSALRNKVQDFKLTNQFSQFKATSSLASTLTADISGENPVVGAYTVNVTQLASSTVASSNARLGSAINPGATLNSSGISQAITAGTFSINGIQFNVDPATNSLTSVLTAINSSAAGVTATYDSVNDRVVVNNNAANDTSIINFGATSDTSNFLQSISLDHATQATGTNGSTQATSTLNLGAVDPSKTLNQVNFAGGAITGGSIRVNGVAISVDPTTDSLSDVIQRINDSDAGVQASYDSSNDTIRVVSNTSGSRTIGFTAGTSNFLNVTNLTTATQTAGNDAQFTINGGPTLTRNTNQVSDAVGGVTLNLLSTGSSTVTVGVDNDAIVKSVQDFITQFNTTVTDLRNATAQGGTLENDGSLRVIEDYLRSTVFNTVQGLSGTFQSLGDIGISTGDSFDANAVPQLQLNEDTFRQALATNRSNVSDLFSNSNGTGITDQLFSYVDAAAGTSGFLNERVKSNGTIDQQIQGLNDQIDSMNERLKLKEARLKQEFSNLEQLAATYKSQSSSLTGISNIFGSTG